jgi:hypothetical protein
MRGFSARPCNERRSRARRTVAPDGAGLNSVPPGLSQRTIILTRPARTRGRSIYREDRSMARAFRRRPKESPSSGHRHDGSLGVCNRYPNAQPQSPPDIGRYAGRASTVCKTTTQPFDMVSIETIFSRCGKRILGASARVCGNGRRAGTPTVIWGHHATCLSAGPPTHFRETSSSLLDGADKLQRGPR